MDHSPGNQTILKVFASFLNKARHRDRSSSLQTNSPLALMDPLILRLAFLCLFLFGCSRIPSEKAIYYKYKIGSNNPIDSMEFMVRSNVYSVQSENDGDVLELKFWEANSRLHISSSSCDTTVSIRLNIGEVAENNCKSLFPFLGKKLSILDLKIIQVESKKYKIYKIFNEVNSSYLNSSTIFWCEEIGVVFIKIEEGEYFELQKCNPILMSLLKQDKDFLELWPIPKLPLIPDSIGQSKKGAEAAVN